MYARRTATQASPDKAEAAKQAIESRLIPMVSDLPGFRGTYWLIDRQRGRGEAFSFFDTKENLESSLALIAQNRDAVLRELSGDLVAVEHYEVARDTGQKVHRDASHARVLHIQGDPADIDEAMQIVEERVIPALRGIRGFSGGFWLVDRATGKGVGVTLYDTSENFSASREQAAALRARTADTLKGTISDFEEYEVLTRAETPAPVGAG